MFEAASYKSLNLSLVDFVIVIILSIKCSLFERRQISIKSITEKHIKIYSNDLPVQENLLRM